MTAVILIMVTLTLLGADLLDKTGNSAVSDHKYATSFFFFFKVLQSM